MADDFRTTEVGERYAQALFDLADETGALDAVRADLKSLRAAWLESADLRRLATSPVITAEDQGKGLTAIATQAKFNGVPDSLAALGYDSARVVIDALKRAPDTSGPALRDAIAQTKDFPGVAGNITLDDKRNPVKPAVVLKVEGGKFKYVDTVSP